MKKSIYILIALLAMLMGGCGNITEAEEPISNAGLPELGSIYIITDDEPGDEYAQAWVTMNRGEAVESQGYDCIAAGIAGQGVDAQPGEIKLRGNSSREVAKKAYTIKFEEEQSLLGMDPGRKWALVSNPFDKSLLRPAVGFAYAEALGLDYVSQTRLCKVWLNDVYMGVYTAMEPVEAGAGRVEIDVENEQRGAVSDDGEDAAKYDFLLERNIGRYEDDKVYIDSPAGLRFEFNEPDEPDAEQQEMCWDMLAAAEEAICSGDHEQYGQLIDVDSFVNFYIFHEMIKDVDFGEYSTRYYFEDGVLHAGPPWDLDLTMGNVSADKEEFKYTAYNNVDGAGDVLCQVLPGLGAGSCNPDDLNAFTGSARGLWAATGDYYYWLCRDPWFMERVQQRWQAVRLVTENLAVYNELGDNLIDRYLAAYEEELAGNFAEAGYAGDPCWSSSEPGHMSEWQDPADTYRENVEMLRIWLIQRAAYLDSQFGPHVYTPTLAVQ